MTAYVTTWLLDPTYSLVSDPNYQLRSLEQSWINWDAHFFLGIASDGYQRPETAFMPAFPVLLRGGAQLYADFTVVGLALNLLFGTIAAILLRRLAARWGGSGIWAVVALAVAPTTVFMLAPYTEALFLAVLLGAWLAAPNRHYGLMTALLSVAVMTRLNGLFAIPAFVIILASQRGPKRPFAWLLVPLAFVVGWIFYLHSLTGDYFEMTSVQREFWNNSLTDPFSALSVGLTAAFSPENYLINTSFTTLHLFVARMQLIALLVLVIATVALAWMRRWPEFTYLLLSLIMLQNTTGYISLQEADICRLPICRYRYL